MFELLYYVIFILPVSFFVFKNIYNKKKKCYTNDIEDDDGSIKVSSLFATLCRMYIDSSIKCCPASLLLTDEIYPTLYDDNIGRPQKHTRCCMLPPAWCRGEDFRISTPLFGKLDNVETWSVEC